jgi:hypothetical protein
VDVLISVDDAIRERADFCAQQVMVQFGRAILPIYASLHKSHKHIATCTALRIDGKQYLVTAGHVIDEYQHGQLWVGGEEKLALLSGRYFASQPPGGDRKQDHYDFAVIQIGAELAGLLGDVVYIGTEHISANRRLAEKKVLYLCVGYPNSKNKNADCQRRSGWRFLGPRPDHRRPRPRHARVRRTAPL